jgi:hypothetical protein
MAPAAQILASRINASAITGPVREPEPQAGGAPQLQNEPNFAPPASTRKKGWQPMNADKHR